jgi:hypothetical protein
LFFKCVQMFCHKSKGKYIKGECSSSSQACLGMSTELFAVMVYLIFIYMSSFIITLLLHLMYFIVIFICRALLHLDTDKRSYLRLCTMRASSRWVEHGRCSRRMEPPNSRLPRRRRSERPSRRLPRRQTSRMRLMTRHRSPTG